jgi:F-type H+-transporting ATPase subunit alpha
MTEILKQPQYAPVPMALQVAILYAVTNGYLDDVAVEKIGDFEEKLRAHMETSGREVLKTIAQKKELDEKTENELKKTIEQFKKSYT